MKKLLLLFAMLLTTVGVSAENYILYTSYGKEVTPYNENAFGNAHIVLNTCWEGKGKILFDREVTKIGYDAFLNCTRLKSVEIPNSVTEIGSSAFSGCSSLTSVVIPNSVTTIGSEAFDGCGVEFYTCDNEKFLTYFSGSYLKEVIIGNSVTTIGSDAFRYCSSLTSVEIGNSVTEIGSSAFWGCTSLTSVEIPNSVTWIGESAFWFCTSLTSVEIGNSVTTIEKDAFCGCSSLTSVEIPNSVTEMYGSVFSYCDNLREVTSLNPTPPHMSSSCFESKTYNQGVLRVPKGSVELYKQADYWKNFSNIKEIVYVESVTLSEAEVELKVGRTHQLTATVLPENAYDKTVTWTSSNENVATVSADGMVTATGAGTAVVTATCGTVSATCTVTVLALVRAESVTLNQTEVALWAGESYQLTATVLPEDVDDKTVTWTTNDWSARVSADGLVTATGAGTAVITATCGTVSATCTVNVTVHNKAYTLRTARGYMPSGEKLTSVEGSNYILSTANKSEAGIFHIAETNGKSTIYNIGLKKYLSANGTPTSVYTNTPDGTFSIEPATDHGGQGGKWIIKSNVTDKWMMFGGSNQFLNNDDWATADDGDQWIMDEVSIADEVQLNDTDVALIVGDSHQLTATILPDDIIYKDVTWTSSNTAVATVTGEGLVTAVGSGTAVITATCGSVSATCTVTVTTIPAESITLSETELVLHVGDSHSLTATVLPENASFKNVTWTSSDTRVATVSRDGLVTGRLLGTTVITATCGNVSATCTVTVTSIHAESVTLNDTGVELNIGDSHQLTASVLPENTSNKTVTWTTSDVSVAMVTGEGLVTGVMNGSATITAKCGSVSATCMVTVLATPTVLAESITLNDTEIKINTIGVSHQLTATILPESATYKTVTWTSSNAAVASVTGEGLVTAVGSGTTVITATCGSVSAKCKVMVGIGGVAPVADVLTASMLKATNTSYTSFSGVTATSEAVYAGQSAKNYNAIQLRSSGNNSGIVTTASGGKVAKVAVVWNSNTTSGRTLNIYGSNKPYTSAADLYGSNAGTRLGSIVCGTSTELTITGDYAYIGFRSNSGAMYLDKAEITWVVAGEGTPAVIAGDANGDGVVDISDASAIISIIHE